MEQTSLEGIEYVERRKNLMESGLWSDCELRIGPTGKVYRAHRLYLAAASQILETMLMEQKKGANIVCLPDISPNTFNIILQYIYHLPIEYPEMLSEVMEAYVTARKLQMHELMDMCTEQLAIQGNSENLWILKQALNDGLDNLNAPDIQRFREMELNGKKTTMTKRSLSSSCIQISSMNSILHELKNSKAPPERSTSVSKPRLSSIEKFPGRHFLYHSTDEADKVSEHFSCISACTLTGVIIPAKRSHLPDVMMENKSYLEDLEVLVYIRENKNLLKRMKTLFQGSVSWGSDITVELTEPIFCATGTVLEITVKFKKTGLYPLYYATSQYLGDNIKRTHSDCHTGIVKGLVYEIA